MKSKTILVILALKLHIGHKRLETNISTKIKINEETQFLQDGYNSNPIETPSDKKIKNRIWTDEIGNVLSSRGMYFCNNDFNKSIISQKNKMIMLCPVDYVKEKNLKREILAPINYARIRKNYTYLVD